MFTKTALTAHLRHPLPQIILLNETDSTNLRCKALAEENAPECTLVIAGTQSAGRGRLGRSFYSPENTGLYMSLLLRPTIAPTEALSITTCAAVCVSEAIEALVYSRTGQHVQTGIKWVNDVFLGGKKVCGILTEATFTPDGEKLRYAVLGIGVNLAPPSEGFPTDIAEVATAVFGAGNSEDLRPALAAAIVDRFLDHYPTLAEKSHYEAYRDRLFLRGKAVDVLWGNRTGHGTCIDVDRDFRLLVQMEDGTVQAIHTGEVSVRERVGGFHVQA